MENEKKLKQFRILAIVQSGVILAAVVLILLSGIMQKKEEVLMTKSQSDNGAYTIAVYEVGKPTLFNHSNTVKAYYSDIKHIQGTAVFTAEVNNGKQKLTEDNYHLEWEDDTAVLYLEGSQQTGTAYKINFDTAEKF